MTDGAGGGSPPEKPGSVPDDREPYTPVEVAFARDGTPVFGFETDPSRAPSQIGRCGVS